MPAKTNGAATLSGLPDPSWVGAPPAIDTPEEELPAQRVDQARVAAASAAFGDRVAIERTKLAIVDPVGEADAAAPLPGSAAWWDLDAERRAGASQAAIDAVGQPLEAFLAERSGPVEQFGPGPDGGLTAFLGPPESFKSMAAMQLGLAGAAGGAFLGMELGEPRPFVYVAGEKSRATIRDRLERMSSRIQPIAPVRIVHREGVAFGNREAWGRLVECVVALGPRTFVACDTIASLAGPGFDENSGKDMAVVLAALRRLGDAGATVAAVHHPNKHGDGVGGVRLRGHTSLWGEIDALAEFTRPDRAIEAGIVRIEPKDGDLRLLHVRWDRETFLLEAEAGIVSATASSIAAVVAALYDGQAVTADQIRVEFPGHGRSSLLAKIAAAVDAGLIARVGRGKSTGYVPVPSVLRASDGVDEPDSEAFGRMPDEALDDASSDRGAGGRMPDGGTERGIVHGGGYIDPPAGRTTGPELVEPEDLDEPEDMGPVLASLFPDFMSSEVSA